MTGNKLFTAKVIGHLAEIPTGNTYAGLEQKALAIVEWLTPSFAFGTPQIQRAHLAEATEIIDQACDQKHPRDAISVTLK